MLTFQDCAAADIDAVFFNAAEHAVTREVNGKPMLCVVQDNVMTVHSTHWEGGAKQSFDSGLYNANTMLRVKVKDFGPRPKVGSELKLDKRSYTIKGVQAEDGVYSFTLERVRQ